MKILNLKGIIILLIVLLIIHFSVGMFVSPSAGKFIVNIINKNSNAKISIEKINAWPLTLSCSMKNIKIFNPDNKDERIVFVPHISMRISFLALLSKRISISGINISGAEINLKGEPDGSFNIQKIAEKPGEKEKKAGISAAEQLKGKKDLFSKIYRMVKKASSKETAEEKSTKPAIKISKEVKKLPKGRIVYFKRPEDQYILEVKKASIENSSLLIEDGKNEVSIKNADLSIGSIGIKTSTGFDFAQFKIKGTVKKEGVEAGNFELAYNNISKPGEETTKINLKAKDIDLPSISFIFQDSLPVAINKGKFDLESKTLITNGALDSKNSLVLRDHEVSPRPGAEVTFHVIPIPILCSAINEVNPFEMSFSITGTTSKPEFKGFQDSLLKIVKPYISGMADDLKKEGENYIKDFLKPKSDKDSPEEKDSSESDPLDKIKSIFK